MVTSEGLDPRHDELLRQGRALVVGVVVFLSISTVAALAAAFASYGRLAIPLLPGAWLMWKLMQRLYRGSSWARWSAIVLLLVQLFWVLMLAIESEASAGVRLALAMTGLICSAAILILRRSRAVTYFLFTKWAKDFMPQAPLDGKIRHGGRTIDEWIVEARSADSLVRQEAVQALGYFLNELENAEAERALLMLARDPAEEVRYKVTNLLAHEAAKVIRHQRSLAIEVLRAIRREPLPADALLFQVVEDPDVILERLNHDAGRVEKAARIYHMFTAAGNALRNLGVDPAS